MNNTEKYRLLLEREINMESNMAIIPRDNSFKFDAEAIKRSLADNRNIKVVSFSEENDEKSGRILDVYYKARIAYAGETYEVEFYLLKVSELHLQEYGFANNIDDESLRCAHLQQYALGVSLYFGENNLNSFHFQLILMHTIIPKASLVIDFMSYRLLSPYWLKMAAESSVPPSPDYLYTLHCVYDEKKDGKRRYWFHTHGLQRCGSVELEMLNIGDGAEQMHILTNMTVKKFLSNPAKERERFTIGYDGMGINLCWLRWEEALNDFPSDILGGMADREGEGNIHCDPGGVLFAVEDQNMVSPEIYAQTLAVNPIYYITTEETQRMSALAKERFGSFAKIFQAKYINPDKKNLFQKMFGKKNNQDENWSFLVKLGLNVDDEETNDEREHLWFEVLQINGDKIKGKLLNQPYWIAKLNEGDVNEYSTDVLTDWIIYAPEATYTPDTIYELQIKEE